MAHTIEALLPDFGDGDGSDAVVVAWSADTGARVSEGDDLLEVETDKASFIAPCPVTGLLLEKRVYEEDRVRVGDVIAILEVDDAAQ